MRLLIILQPLTAERIKTKLELSAAGTLFELIARNCQCLIAYAEFQMVEISPRIVDI